MKKPLILPFHKFNAWQMASIFGSGIGLPSILIGGQIGKELGAGTAIISILIGNLFLWIIGLGIISMSERNDDAIENVKDYLGNTTGIIATIILILPILFWFAIQVKVEATIAQIVSSGNLSEQSLLWFGIILGLAVAILSFWGIKLIVKFCVMVLPILISFILFIAITSKNTVIFRDSWGFSLKGTLAILFTWLPGTVNFPTFFRHSKSKANSFFAISLITFFHIFYQIGAVMAGLNEMKSFLNYISYFNSLTLLLLATTILLLFFLCINLINIYFASAGWDAVVSLSKGKWNYKGKWKFPFMGVLGTLVYIFMGPSLHITSPSLIFVETMLTSFVSNLGIVLLVDYLISIFAKHRPRAYQKFWSSICWLVGCLTGAIVQVKIPQIHLFAGINASLLSFLVILFVEETVWSIKNLDNKTQFHIGEE